MLTIIRYGEISLKGQNRSYFENRLCNNIRTQTQCKVWKGRNRIYIGIDKDNLNKLNKVFGIVSYSPCIKAELSYESIKEAIMNLGLDGHHDISFRITCQRLQKNFKPSREIEKEIGSFVNVQFGFSVDLTNYDIEINIEITDNAYIYIDKMKGLGGFPVGVAGEIGCKLDNEKILLSAFLLMKRGAKIVLIEGSEEGFIQRLQSYTPYTLKNTFGNEYVAIASSDTLDNLNEEEGFVLRPLVGMDNNNIKQNLKQIGAQ